jgi:hypothetical protein
MTTNDTAGEHRHSITLDGGHSCPIYTGPVGEHRHDINLDGKFYCAMMDAWISPSELQRK